MQCCIYVNATTFLKDFLRMQILGGRVEEEDKKFIKFYITFKRYIVYFATICFSIC